MSKNLYFWASQELKILEEPEIYDKFCHLDVVLFFESLPDDDSPIWEYFTINEICKMKRSGNIQF